MFFFIIVVGLLCHGCNNEEKGDPDGGSCCSSTGPVYVGKFNDISYVDYVCVIFSFINENGISPQPEEVDYAKPIPVGDGYYEIRWGCQMMTDITYSEYKNFETLDAEFIQSRIIDENPFSEMYECCNLCIMLNPLNEIVDENRLSERQVIE